MAAGLRLWLLGGFRVEVDGQPVPERRWRRRKACSLVKLLALAPRHRLHREQLMDALWPDLPPYAAGANLRKAVYFARQTIGAEALRSGEDLHWAGQQMLEMVERLATRGDGPYLLVGTTRPELLESRRGFAAGIEGSSTISLRALSDAESATLLRQLPVAQQIPEETASEILARAEGNQFFIEQLAVHRAHDPGNPLPDALYADHHQRRLRDRIGACPAVPRSRPRRRCSPADAYHLATARRAIPPRALGRDVPDRRGTYGGLREGTRGGVSIRPRRPPDRS